MRINCDNPADVVRARRARAYLNDVEVRACIMADEEAGMIERWETDADGRVMAFHHQPHHSVLKGELVNARCEVVEGARGQH